ncbi:hypothetical protein RyT2_09420 [Pseudolactococcus yaeyamensis]
MNKNYGIHRGIGEKIKFWGVSIFDGLIVLGAFLLAVQMISFFPPTQFIQMIIWLILTILLAIFAVLPINGDSKMWKIFWITLTRKTAMYFSIEQDKIIG